MGVCVLQVTLAYESIVLYMCEGKVLMDLIVFECVIYKTLCIAFLWFYLAFY